MVSEQVIDRVRWLRGIPAGAKRELAARSVVRRFAANQVLWRERDAPRGIFVVLEGGVRVVRGTGRRQYVLHREGLGGTLGEVPLFGGGSYPATAVAERPTDCLVLTRGALEAAIGVDPRLALLLLGRLADRVLELIRRLERVTLQPVQARLAAHLLTRHLQAGSTEFTLGESQQRLAEDLGTVREVIVRGIRKLVQEGVIRRMSGGRFAILNLRRLERMVEPVA